MKRFGEWHYRLALVVVAMVVCVPLIQWVRAQGRNAPVHLTTDWSNRHMIYSQPKTLVEAFRLNNDARYGHQWVRRNAAALTNAAIEREGGLEAILHNRGGHGPGGPGGPLNPKTTQESLRADWGMSLLAGGTNGAEMFPAKFTFDVNAVPDCIKDYVVYNTSLTGSGVTATGTISDGGFFTGPANGDTVTVGAVTYTFTSGTPASANRVALDTSFFGAANSIQNLRGAIDGLSSECSSGGTCFFGTAANTIVANAAVTHPAAFASPTITLTSATAGAAGDFPLTSSNGTNIPVTGGNNGSGPNATIIAFNELYSTQGGSSGLCNNVGPSVYWAYSTGASAIATSPVISGNGTMVAYVENSGPATLHILKFKAGEGTAINAPVTPTTTLTAGQNWTTNCPVGNSCIMNIAFSGAAAASDSNSSPFYNYNTDTLYIGDDNGHLHKFTGVFLGAPAEVTTAPWPILVKGAGVILSSPVMDNSSKNIFVGDSTGTFSYVKEVGSASGGTSGTCSGGGNVTPCLGQTLGASGSGTTTTINVSTGASSTSNGASASGAIVDAPIVDGSVSSVYVVNGTETGANRGTMIETNTALGLTGTPGSVIANIKLGGNAAGSVLHTGAFDNAYLTSAGGTGTLYMCGKDPGFNDRPAIYHLTITAGVLSTTVNTVLVGFVSSSQNACSPLTEVENPNATGGAKEWIFFSIGNNASGANPIPAGACRTTGAGCILSIDVTSLTTVASWNTFAGASGPATAAVSLPAAAANVSSTSGIIVDNVAAPGTPADQVSSIYFSLTGTSTGAGPGLPSCNTTAGVGCAVKLTQAALQ